MRLLHDQISAELKKIYTHDEAFAWLASPQKVLGLRIPARMMATGEAAEVLGALRKLAVDRARRPGAASAA